MPRYFFFRAGKSLHFPVLFIQLGFNSVCVCVIDVSDATHNSNEYSWVFESEISGIKRNLFTAVFEWFQLFCKLYTPTHSHSV